MLQVLLVHCLIGVLLRIEHPDDQIHDADQPVRLDPIVGGDRVHIGQIEQHQSAQRRLVLAVQRALPHETPARGDAKPVQQRVGATRVPHARVRLRGGGT